MKTQRILSLVVIGGIPGGFSLRFPDPLKGWVTTALPIHDLATLADSRSGLLQFLHSSEHDGDLSYAWGAIDELGRTYEFSRLKISYRLQTLPDGR